MTSRSEQSHQRVVIVGAGLAGVQTAVQLREQGWAGAVILMGAEPHRPYDRPPLSKAVLSGKAAGSAFDIDYAALGITLRLGSRAQSLDPQARVVRTADGEVPYDRLVVATGAEAVALPGAGRPAPPGVHVLRTLDDAERLRPVLAGQVPLVVVGAGWIGAELTTAAREAGCQVTVVEAADRPLAGALPAEVAGHMRGWYAECGAVLRTGTAVAEVRAGEVALADGTVLPAGAVVVGIGARPATGWLAGSGVELSPDGSVRADEQLRTSVPDVYAVGDCASFPSARYGRRLLVHHWDNALQGPRSVAAGLVGGDAGQAVPVGGADSAVYDPVPYFWSEQFGRFVQFAGYAAEGDELVWRGDPGGASWAVCWLREGRLRALLAVGRPRDTAQGRKLIGSGAPLDRALAADPSVPLKKAAGPAVLRPRPDLV